jgi:hypothetical protein
MWLLAIGLLATAGGACTAGDPSPRNQSPHASRPAVPDDITLEQVYVRMLDALDNGIAHVTITSEAESKLFEDYALDNTDLVTEIWFDADKEAAKRIRKSETIARDFKDLILSGTRWEGPDDDGGSRSVQALVCRGTDSALLSALSMCGNYIEESRTHVETNVALNGEQGLVAIVTEGDAPDSDTHFFFTSRLYIDPASWLPMAAVMDGVRTLEKDYDVHVESRYEIDFLDRVEDDFFLPVSVGYSTDAAFSRLRVPHPDDEPFWLGEVLSNGGQEARINASHYAGDSESPPGLGVAVVYSVADRPAFSVRSFRASGWAELLALPTESTWWAGLPSEEVTVEGRRVVIIRDQRSGEDRFAAQVYLPGAVAEVTTYLTHDGFNSREAMLSIARQRREVPDRLTDR